MFYMYNCVVFIFFVCIEIQPTSFRSNQIQSYDCMIYSQDKQLDSITLKDLKSNSIMLSEIRPQLIYSCEMSWVSMTLDAKTSSGIEESDLDVPQPVPLYPRAPPQVPLRAFLEKRQIEEVEGMGVMGHGVKCDDKEIENCLIC